MARAASSSAGYMIVPPPGCNVARSFAIFCMSPASVSGTVHSKSASNARSPTRSNGFRSSIDESAADFTTSSLVSPVGTVAPMLPDLSTTMTRDSRGICTCDFTSMSTGSALSMGVL